MLSKNVKRRMFDVTISGLVVGNFQSKRKKRKEHDISLHVGQREISNSNRVCVSQISKTHRTTSSEEDTQRHQRAAAILESSESNMESIEAYRCGNARVTIQRGSRMRNMKQLDLGERFCSGQEILGGGFFVLTVGWLLKINVCVAQRTTSYHVSTHAYGENGSCR